MTDDATRADKAGSQRWLPGKAEVSEVISAGSPLGKPCYSERLRRKQPGDKDVGVIRDTVLDGWKIREVSPKVWATDNEEGN